MSEILEIPSALKPLDGRFGSGPSRVSAAQVAALSAANPHILGTSHRQAPVKNLVAQVRSGLATLFNLPDGYEVVLGNGGSTFFWDTAVFSLIRERSAHASFGEFGAKFAAAVAAAPHLGAPEIYTAPAGSACTVAPTPDADVYAWPHNETSTGAAIPVVRPAGTALTVIDGTSAAGGMLVDAREFDVYYFAPQKGFGADGGLWWALMSPAALERTAEIAASGRYIPASLSLQSAVENSRADQTLNTPAVGTLLLMGAQLQWMLDHGGLEAMAARSQKSSRLIYDWAERRDFATPFVSDEQYRSPVVATVDLDEHIDSSQVRAILRHNGIVDIDPYRKLGRNQLRIGVFPNVDPADVEALLACIDFVVEHIRR